MIRVLHNYRGAPSKEQLIVAGDYEENDEQLFGLAQYLVSNGHAVAMQGEGSVELAEEGGGDGPPPQDEPQEEREVPDVSKMTLAEIERYLSDTVALSDDPAQACAHIDAMRASERIGKGRAGAEALFEAAYEEMKLGTNDGTADTAE